MQSVVGHACSAGGLRVQPSGGWWAVLLALLVKLNLSAATFTVTSTADSGPGTLRQAISDANAAGGTNRIEFRIAGPGPHTIGLTSAGLPNLHTAMVIDGYTQTGARPNARDNGDDADLRIRVSGAGLSAGTDGFRIQAGATIRGLAIVDFGGNAIHVGSGLGAVVQGNFIGLDVDGVTVRANGGAGIRTTARAGLFGGPSAADRNVIAGNRGGGIQLQNAASNVVQGNFLGTDASGTLARGNEGSALVVERAASVANRIIGNVIAASVGSGQSNHGIEIADAADNTIAGNFIGTDLAGVADLGNNGSGIYVSGWSLDNWIGGRNPGEGNTIAHNTRAGVHLSAGVGPILGNSIHDNGGLGIDLGTVGVSANDGTDLDVGANNLINFPVLTNAVYLDGVTTIQGRLQGIGLLTYRVEFFANAAADGSGYGEGQYFLGATNVTLSVLGSGAIVFRAATGSTVGRYVTATTTGPDNDTSEFARAVPVQSGQLVVTEPPASNVLAAVGDGVTLGVGVTGPGGLTYQWYFEGQALAGETNASLAIGEASAAVAGHYYAVIIGAASSVTTAVSTVTVLAQHEILPEKDTGIRAAGHPLNDGAATNLVVDRGGTGIGNRRALFQFDLGSLPAEAMIRRASLGLYAVANGGAFNVNVYRLMESWTEGDWDGSAGVANWNDRADGMAWTTAGGTFDPAVVAANSTNGLGWHRWDVTGLVDDWYRGGTTNHGVILGSEDTGSSTVTYSSREGTVAPRLVVDFDAAPWVVIPPRAQVVELGGNVTLDVEVDGTAPFGFQWQFGGVPIAGAVAGSLELTNVTAAAAGSYTVVVTNHLGVVTSAAARLIVETAPILSGVNHLAPIGQNEFTNAGTRVADLLAGRVTNPGADAESGIAVTGVSTNHGLWQYSTNGGGAWIDFGLPSTSAARLLGADLDTRVRFLPETNWTGTVAAGLTLQAWNRTSGTLGGTADLRVANLADQFVTISYANNDGSDNWAGDWTENDSGAAGPETGWIWVADQRLQVEARQAGDSIYRAADLRLAETATLTLSYTNGLGAGDRVRLELWREGVSTVLETFTEPSRSRVGNLRVDLSPYSGAIVRIGVQVIASGAGGRLGLGPISLRSSATGGGTAFSVDSAAAGVTVALTPSLLVMTDIFTNSPGSTDPTGFVQTNNAAAGVEVGEPRHDGKDGGKSMWFVWRAPADGIAAFSTAGSDFDTRLAVYQGLAVNALTPVASDDDEAGEFKSRVEFNVLADSVYQVAVDGARGATGTVELRWVFEATADRLPRITNHPIDRVVYRNSNSVFAVGVEGVGVEYQWYFNGGPVVDGTNSSWGVSQAGLGDVGLYWVVATLGSRTVRSRAARLQLDLNPGLVQDVAIADKFVDVLSAERRLRLDPPPPASIQASGPIRGYSGTQVFSTVGSLKDPGEPEHCGVPGGASQWFAYQADADGVLALNTDGSTFDTVLAVYTGPGATLSQLTSVACDNDSGTNGRTSSLHFITTAGTIYYIVVDGVEGASGTVMLNYTTLGERVGPTLTLTSAPPVQVGLTNDTLSLGGTASDESGLLAVEWRMTNQFGATAWTNVSGVETWSVTVSGLVVGTNHVQLRSLDTWGNVSSIRDLAYRRLAPVQIDVVGCGEIAPGLQGTIYQEPGSTLTLSVRPCSDWLFAGWSGDRTSIEPVLVVGVQTGLVLQATFVVNPFGPRSGSYSGLFYDTNVVAADRAGSVTLRTTSKGSFSGRLRIGARNRPFSGRFGADGYTTNVVRGAPTDPPLTVRLDFNARANSDGVAGAVLAGEWAAELAAFRGTFHTRTNPASRQGVYTVLLPANGRPGTPEGDGYMGVTVSSGGAVRMRGALADGTPISQAAFLSRDGLWPFYLPFRAGRGAAWSWWAFGSNAATVGSTVVTGELGASLYWIVPSMSTARLYPAGFTNVLEALGARFIPPTDPSHGALTFSQGEVVLSGGELATPLTNAVTRTGNDRFWLEQTNRFNLVISPASGLLRGSVVEADSRRVLNFKGAVLQSGDLGAGYFLDTNRSGRVLVAPVTGP